MPALMPVYARADVYFERGEGCHLFDEHGRRYLDFVSGAAVTAFGHAHPAITRALSDQAQRLWIASNLYKSRGLEKLAQRLVDASFAYTVFLQNSGAEAWELGVKVIRKYFSAVGRPQRYRIICFEGCFHGRMLAGISAAKTERMAKGFGPMTPGFDQVGWNDLEQVRAAIGPETAAILIEPVQGEGGMRVASPEFLRGLRRICDESGLLLYFDEIQCGLGRTGRLFACEWAGVTPDLMCIGKALGNGFPIGACLATAEAALGMTPGCHGSTFGGNALATAVGNAVLDLLLAPGFLTEVEKTGRYLEDRLAGLVESHPGVFTGRRGKGLMGALRCVQPNYVVVDALRAEGLLAIAGGENVVRLLPPLIVTERQIDEAVAIISSVANKTSQEESDNRSGARRVLAKCS
jgi:acetylornithine/N-succinyldiaminopimelate aminotransferase